MLLFTGQPPKGSYMRSEPLTGGCMPACKQHGQASPARGTRPRKFTSKMGKLAKMRPNLAYRYGIRMPTSTAKISYKKVLNSHECRGCCVQELNLLKKKGMGPFQDRNVSE